ncbi:hypothetical protein M9H77_20716 [Catharanthus roseus]|uniref:Uncharacterized protein n=1 Tax=Catharanthus roseus TaxID=4058 RepID=A0ACC0AKB6_CATRO|nr:hypothetical protein M9H77_20716 [Catharanthus roseus]
MASMLRTERFELGLAQNLGLPEEIGILDWWSNIEESEKWQHGSFYTLCALYAMVSCIALVQLIRIQLRVPEYGWTTQKVFHLMNFVVTGCKAIELMLLDLPGLLFFSTYTLLVLFWAEIYHQARNLPVEKLRPTYYIINALIYLIQVCIWVYIRLSQNPAAVEVSRLFFSVISFCAALGFLVYGGRLFIMLQRFPIESVSRQRKLQEVGYVTGICCACFLIRCIMDAFSAFDEDADLAVSDHPILILFYYMIVEILPSSLVLFILRKLPPRRVSDRYQSIN